LKNTNLSQAGRSAILWEVLNDQQIWKSLRYSPDDTLAEIERRYLHE